jgi:hypothetical protein
MKHLYHNHILNQFPPLRRKSLLRWVRESGVGRKAYHKAFLACLEEIAITYRDEILDRRTKIAFSLMVEFGQRLSRRAVYSTLIDAVDHRMTSESARK